MASVWPRLARLCPLAGLARYAMSRTVAAPSESRRMLNGTSPVVLTCVRLGPLRPQEAAALRQDQEPLPHLNCRPPRMRGGLRADGFPGEDAGAEPSPLSQVVRESEETAPLARRASPRKPRASTRARSSALLILLIGCAGFAYCTFAGILFDYYADVG